MRNNSFIISAQFIMSLKEMDLETNLFMIRHPDPYSTETTIIRNNLLCTTLQYHEVTENEICKMIIYSLF